LFLAIVVTLSTINLDAERNPFAFVGLINKRNNGASVSSEVNAQIVIEPVASKASS